MDSRVLSRVLLILNFAGKLNFPRLSALISDTRGLIRPLCDKKHPEKWNVLIEIDFQRLSGSGRLRKEFCLAPPFAPLIWTPVHSIITPCFPWIRNYISDTLSATQSRANHSLRCRVSINTNIISTQLWFSEKWSVCAISSSPVIIGPCLCCTLLP